MPVTRGCKRTSMQTRVHLSVESRDMQAARRAVGPPRSPVSVEDGFHLRDVGLERDGAEFIQLLVVEQ